MSLQPFVIASGTKRGRENFFSTAAADDQGPFDYSPYSVAIDDIRAVIHFNQAKKELYSISFTEEYTVYARFMSIYDWENRDGGYLAINLCVPHGFSCREGIKVPLDKLFKAYSGLYLDSSFRIKKGREDINIFRKILSKYEFKAIGNHYSNWPISPHNKKFAKVIYEDKDQLTSYLDTPYRSTYRNFQQVFLISAELANTHRLDSMTALELSPDYERINLRIRVSLEGSSEPLNFADYEKLLVNGNQVKREEDLFGLDQNSIVEISINEIGYEDFQLNQLAGDLNTDHKGDSYRIEEASGAYTLRLLLKKKKMARGVILKNRSGEILTPTKVLLDDQPIILRKLKHKDNAYLIEFWPEKRPKLQIDVSGYKSKVIQLPFKRNIEEITLDKDGIIISSGKTENDVTHSLIDKGVENKNAKSDDLRIKIKYQFTDGEVGGLPMYENYLSVFKGSEKAVIEFVGKDYFLIKGFDPGISYELEFNHKEIKDRDPRYQPIWRYFPKGRVTLMPPETEASKQFTKHFRLSKSSLSSFRPSNKIFRNVGISAALLLLALLVTIVDWDQLAFPSKNAVAEQEQTKLKRQLNDAYDLLKKDALDTSSFDENITFLASLLTSDQVLNLVIKRNSQSIEINRDSVDNLKSNLELKKQLIIGELEERAEEERLKKLKESLQAELDSIIKFANGTDFNIGDRIAKLESIVYQAEIARISLLYDSLLIIKEGMASMKSKVNKGDIIERLTNMKKINESIQEWSKKNLRTEENKEIIRLYLYESFSPEQNKFIKGFLKEKLDLKCADNEIYQKVKDFYKQINS